MGSVELDQLLAEGLGEQQNDLERLREAGLAVFAFDFLNATLAWSSAEAACRDAQECIDFMDQRANAAVNSGGRIRL